MSAQEARDATPLTREQWLERCAARYKACVPGITDEFSMHCATATLEAQGDMNNAPEQAADDDLSCWSD